MFNRKGSNLSRMLDASSETAEPVLNADWRGERDFLAADKKREMDDIRAYRACVSRRDGASSGA